MLIERSLINIADNCGANTARLFAVNGKGGKRFAKVGDIVMAAVQTASPNSKVKRRQKVKVLIVRTKKEVKRKDGSAISFSDNAGVVVKDGSPIGTRVFGPIAREIRDLGYTKIVSLADEVL